MSWKSKRMTDIGLWNELEISKATHCIVWQAHSFQNLKFMSILTCFLTSRSVSWKTSTKCKQSNFWIFQLLLVLYRRKSTPIRSTKIITMIIANTRIFNLRLSFFFSLIFLILLRSSNGFLKLLVKASESIFRFMAASVLHLLMVVRHLISIQYRRQQKHA